jgi:butyryl-CoA dehydrogenase
VAETNPLITDREARFLLFELLDVEALCGLPHFADHSRQTFELYVQAAAKLGRDVVLPTYKPMDAEPAYFKDGRVHAHPCMNALYPQLCELGVLTANRPYDVGGQQLPLCVAALAAAHVMAANLSAFGYCMLTSGAAHLIEAFGSDELKRTFMQPMYEGRFTGTMALTEPHAGSSLGDLRTRARSTPHGHYLIDGSKVFISGADHGFAENIVHLVLARIEGAPAGSRGISLFAVPRSRQSPDGSWIDNDVHAAGAFHKLGWRGIASIALNFGERGDCHGYLVGAPHQGLPYMFQMMNEARIQIGIHAVATASVAYHESLQYARTRPQGRAPGASPDSPQVAIIEHADVRRMLLRQKAIVEGGFALVLETARCQDLALHAKDKAERERASMLLELLTPIAKTFPAERGFESNTLAVQVHGGYGYTSEYLPEAWLRDQKLNSIHEGTTGIQSQDLLGRKILRSGGRALEPLREAMLATCRQAASTKLGPAFAAALERACLLITSTTAALCDQAARDPRAALRHSADYLDMLATAVVGWQWLRIAVLARGALDAGAGTHDTAFYRGKLRAAQYWFNTELPRVALLAQLCVSGEDSYDEMQPDAF